MLDRVAGGDEIEVRRAADLEAPREDPLVKLTRPLDVGRKNLEVCDVIGHALDSPCPESETRLASS